MIQPAVYRSKVEWWIAVPVTCSLLAPLTIGLWRILTGAPRREDQLMTVIGAIVILFTCAVAIPMRYQFLESGLFLRSGLLTRRLPYSTILEVGHTRNPLASWAWSLDRLEITLSDFDSIMISPIRKQEFVAELRRRVPGLKVVGSV